MVLLMLIAGAISLLTAGPVLADNCGSPDDCFATADAANTAMVGLLFMSALSILFDLMPIAGDVKGAYEAFTGEDSFTGRKLEWWERVLGAIPLLGHFFKGAVAMRGIARAGDTVSDVARAGAKVDDADDLARGMGRADDVVDASRGGTRLDDTIPAGTRGADDTIPAGTRGADDTIPAGARGTDDTVPAGARGTDDTPRGEHPPTPDIPRTRSGDDPPRSRIGDTRDEQPPAPDAFPGPPTRFDPITPDEHRRWETFFQGGNDTPQGTRFHFQSPEHYRDEFKSFFGHDKEPPRLGYRDDHGTTVVPRDSPAGRAHGWIPSDERLAQARELPPTRADEEGFRRYWEGRFPEHVKPLTPEEYAQVVRGERVPGQRVVFEGPAEYEDGFRRTYGGERELPPHGYRTEFRSEKYGSEGTTHLPRPLS
jgi:hypothetical protein